ncbi:hypothetical protein ACFSS9_14915, partial [Paenibacillus septentrionalis]|uniref:hypothetical protein n=1 Tax=Paenibacillus septentrionalis TaxID=429342 RepID=UPI0036455917
QPSISAPVFLSAKSLITSGVSVSGSNVNRDQLNLCTQLTLFHEAYPVLVQVKNVVGGHTSGQLAK